MGLSAQIVAMGALTSEERALWRGWQLASPHLRSPFFHIAFAQTVSEVGKGIAVAKLFDGTRLVGFFPYQRRGQTAYPVGAPMNDYHAVIASPEVSISLDDVARLLPTRRISVNSWIGPDKTAQGEHHLKLSTCQAVMGEGGYQAWLDGRRRAFAKYFKDKDRTRRGMESQLGVIHVDTSCNSPELLDRLIALKSQQYRRTRRHDIFKVKWTRALLHRLLEGDELRASIAALWAGESLLALELSLHADGVWHFWFPAYLDVGRRYSPGIWLSLETMKVESLRGYGQFDYGFSGEAYKKYFCNGREDVVEAVVGDRDWVAAMGGLARRGGLALSIRRRWAAIEAVETDFGGRAAGIVFAAKGMVARLGRGES